MNGSGLVLGINVSHDRSAVLVRDGRVLCGIAEERLDRKKHSVAVTPDGSYLCTLPHKAIDYVLDQAGAVLLDCAAIVAVGSVVYHPQQPLRNLTVADVAAQLPDVLDPQKIFVLNHHFAHALGAYAASPFTEAAILVVDGAGNVIENRPGRRVIPKVEHTTFYQAKGRELRELHKVCSNKRAMNSLGAMYQLATLFAGFGDFQEGKTMGLAPYGSPLLSEQWCAAVRHPAPLAYEIDPTYQTFDIRGRKVPADFIKLFGQPRHHSEELRPVDMDMAFAVQQTLEETLVTLASDLQKATGCTNLVLAGGVALNSVANQQIVERAGFDNVFIVPCAADDGTALGAALWPWYEAGNEKVWSMAHPYLGRTYTREEYAAALAGHDAVLKWFDYADKVPGEIAKRLAAGAVVGWHQGGAEIGPRALGNRSIFCDPRRAANKDLLNEKVKYREAFRPFAPVALLEKAAGYFSLTGASPFMLRVVSVRKPDLVPAVTHVDGTARLQTVTAESNGLLYELLAAFERETGVPVLLNTSFNLAGDPIVETPADAIDCFLKSEMDSLALGPFVVEKRNPELARQLARKHRELMAAQKKVAAQEAELEAIRQSRGWRLLNALSRLRGK